MNKSTNVLIIVAVLIGFIALQAAYVVDEREKAIVTRFGRIVSDDIPPGLHFKIPMVDEAKKFDARVQTTDLEEESYITNEKKNLIVDSFVKWRVIEPRKYYTNVAGQKSNAESRLVQRVNNSLRDEFGSRSVKDVVSGDRVKIMNEVQKAVDTEARAIGIQVVDVRLKRVDLDPDVISESVYPRMTAERQRTATELRAIGRETAARIRADADRQKEIILAEAYRSSQELRGEGDATATGVLADAYNKDKEFFKMFRSLNAYQNTFKDKTDLMIVEPDSQFFNYFQSSELTQ